MALPKGLLDLTSKREDALDLQALDEALHKAEECFSAEVARRMVEGESPLRLQTHSRD